MSFLVGIAVGVILESWLQSPSSNSTTSTTTTQKTSVPIQQPAPKANTAPKTTPTSTPAPVVKPAPTPTPVTPVNNSTPTHTTMANSTQNNSASVKDLIGLLTAQHSQTLRATYLGMAMGVVAVCTGVAIVYLPTMFKKTRKLKNKGQPKSKQEQPAVVQPQAAVTQPPRQVPVVNSPPAIIYPPFNQADTFAPSPSYGTF